jgi:hypothetical protein
MVKIKPSATIRNEMGWLVMERKTALELAQTIQEQRREEAVFEEGEDG